MPLSYVLWYNHHAKLCPYSYLTISRFLLWKMKQRLCSCCYAQMCLKVFFSQKLDTCVGWEGLCCYSSQFLQSLKTKSTKKHCCFLHFIVQMFGTIRRWYDESQCLLFTSMSICLNWEAITIAADLKHTIRWSSSNLFSDIEHAQCNTKKLMHKQEIYQKNLTIRFSLPKLDYWYLLPYFPSIWIRFLVQKNYL
jgi:hypothetical protein